ncbi:MAG TPA: 30S ribosomal protein S6 [Candidatus Portnoybacteria bacterium]|uniref:Small ribosomal subunit protein bS6 n=1 Tax=Candidatus Portnoybacteria bacterium CG02_land_8_20_14_3_00_45_8 TaxID=1974807 RepID=A0A2M7D6K3_9BACT|nr:MAG: 30S ribosomal protein S6 [Candidatus Portnoybacteria bacterium CG02_land_8_20_14_3_00_45_8]HCX27986.1 30S ribosomal protein S6 [Candidatus Portnoybacteria bacterium]
MYELIYLLSPLMERKDIDAAAAKVRSFIIKDLGGQVKTADVWDKRKLGYPIKKQIFGYHAVVEFNLESDKIDELQKNLKSNSDILRFMIITRKLLKEQPLRQRRPAKPKPMVTPEIHKGEKVKIEELDRKLEELLKE